MSEREPAYIPISDIDKALEYSKQGVSSEEYYEKRHNKTINLAETLTEDEKIQWKEPQLILLGGLQRSGKSTVSRIIRDKFNEAGFECKVFNSDNTREIIRKEIEEKLLQNGHSYDENMLAEVTRQLYTTENKKRVYKMMYENAGKFMKETGGVAIVDATHITDEKREDALKNVLGEYGSDEVEFKYIEVSNSTEKAKEIFEYDTKRLEELKKKRLEIEKQGASVENSVYGAFENKEDTKIDQSEADYAIRNRDEALYEQILTKHIKVINNFDDPKDFIRHVREDLFAKV